MHEIDFLPAEYRREHANKRWRSWRILLVLGFTALIALATFGQNHRLQRIESDLDAIAADHERALGQQNDLAEQQSRLLAARADADLFTYLRHPWPRTRILDALLVPLSDEIAFEELQIQLEEAAGQSPGGRRDGRQNRAEEEESANLPPAVQDLKQLRSRFDPKRTVVTIAGVTSNSDAPHRYVGALSKADLFSEAKVPTMESDQDQSGETLRFNATLVVRPGYGQPGGPGGPDENAQPQTPDHKTPGSDEDKSQLR